MIIAEGECLIDSGEVRMVNAMSYTYLTVHLCWINNSAQLLLLLLILRQILPQITHISAAKIAILQA